MRSLGVRASYDDTGCKEDREWTSKVQTLPKENTMTPETLAPCPFCGFDPQQNSLGIQCSSATCHSTQTFTVSDWNNRADIRRIKELEAALREISEFGTANTGCGFTCAKMAKAALRAGTTPTTTP